MNIELKKRYPQSKREDITDVYVRGLDVYMRGFEAGYHQATMELMDERKKLRDALRAILDRGETPEDVGSKADWG